MIVKLKLKPRETVFYRLYISGTSRIYRDMYRDDLESLINHCAWHHNKILLDTLDVIELIPEIRLFSLESSGAMGFKWKTVIVDIKKIIKKQ